MTALPPVSRKTVTLELALIGNCTVSALVDQGGSIVWCCMPRFDSSPVFDALLRSGEGLPLDGAMTVELEGLARVEQAYDPGTAIVRTQLWDASGQGIELADFAPRFLHRDRVFRPAQLVRRVPAT
jgi:GH15 family glucan-1,4-alpha-glucosidase